MNTKNDLPLVLYRFDQSDTKDDFVRSFQEDFELVLCESDDYALQYLENAERQISAVVAQQDVVQQDAVHSVLFEQSKKTYPQALRILVQQNISLTTVVSLLEQGVIDKCFSLPFDDHVIRSEIYATFIGVHSRVQLSSQAEGLAARFYALIVDDEPSATKYLKKQLEVLKCPCDILVANNADSALKLFRQHHSAIAIVISDQRMPGMLGTQLLTEIRNHNTNIIRILTSAYDEVDVALNAVNEGQIYRYIRKPWDAQEMYDCMVSALAEFKLQRSHTDEQQAFLLTAFNQLIAAREVALTERLGYVVDSYAGEGSLLYFFDSLRAIETLAPTKSSLALSQKGALEEELVSVFVKAVLEKITSLSAQTELFRGKDIEGAQWLTGVEWQSLFALISQLTQDSETDLMEDTVLELLHPAASVMLISLQKLLASSNLDFSVMEFKHYGGIYKLSTKPGQDISLYKHMLSAHTRLPRQLVEQQSAMLMLVLAVRHLGCGIDIRGGAQAFSLSLSFSGGASVNDER